MTGSTEKKSIAFGFVPSKSMNRNSKIQLSVIVLISIILLTISAMKLSFWEDETYTATQSQKPVAELLASTHSDVHPVLPLLVASFWGGLFGYDEMGLRSLSILLSGLNLLLTFLLARDLFDASTAILAAAILSISPLFIMFGHQARYYAMMMFGTLVLVLLLRYYLRTQRTIYLVLYATSAGLITYISYTAFSVIIAANLWWLFSWIRTKPRKFSPLATWVIAQVGILLLFLPSVSHIGSLAEKYLGNSELEIGITELFKRGLYLFFTYSVGQTLSPLNPLSWIGCALVASLVVLAFIRRHDQRSLWFVVLFIGVIVIANLLISFLSGWLSQIWQNLPHWSFYALPFWAILLGSGLSKLESKWSIAAKITLLVVFGAAFLNYYSGRQFIQPIYATPWKEIFTNIDENSSSKMALVCRGSDVACRYYAQRFGFSTNLISDVRDIPYDQIDQVWLIQINLGQVRSASGLDDAILEDLSSHYINHEIFPYARQDDALRWLKKEYLGKEDYEYRVTVFHFFTPANP
jgi:uncharacterized membrane protein